jgi:1-acyl-sn-glycerol-3-phosphate acyltransferase
MAKKELFRNPLFGKIISMTHAIPVDRRAPGAQSIKEAIKILKAGKTMMVLPEGTRKNTGKIKYGIGLLAHKSGMPLVPARIVNNDKIKSLIRTGRTGRTGRPDRPGRTNRSGRLIRPAQLKFKIKKPMYYPAEPGEPSSKKDYKLYAESVMEKIYN